MMQILLHAVLPPSCDKHYYESEYKVYERKIELYDSGYGLWIDITQSYHQLNSIQTWISTQSFIHFRIALQMIRSSMNFNA